VLGGSVAARILDVAAPEQRANRADAVLELVDSIPRGRVMTYGDVARQLGIPSPRIVGQVLSSRGRSVAWHRVVLSTGSVAAHLAERQLSLLRDEGVDVRRGRVDLRRCRWGPTSP
jgi:alkylated DNA nucleotide flippase Atl1